MRMVLAALSLGLIAGAAALAQTALPQPPPPPVSLSSPPQANSLANSGLMSPLRPFGPNALAGLPPAGDQAPQCRAACAQVRYACGDDEVCTRNWGQCVRGCGPAPP